MASCAGLYDVDRGSIKLSDQEVKANGLAKTSSMHGATQMIFQDLLSLNARMRVQDIVSLRFYKEAIRKRVSKCT